MGVSFLSQLVHLQLRSLILMRMNNLHFNFFLHFLSSYSMSLASLSLNVMAMLPDGSC